MKNIDKKSTYISMKAELQQYEDSGVLLTIEGNKSNSDEIAHICIFKEDSTYMRDYITNEEGKLVEIDFNNVKLE